MTDPHEGPAFGHYRPGTVVELVRWENGRDGWTAQTVIGLFVSRTATDWELMTVDGEPVTLPIAHWAPVRA